MDSEMILLDATEKMDKAIENLIHRFATVRAGRANPSSLDGIVVEYYGSMTPLKQLATISVPEARQLLIKPFDKGSLGAIEKAILSSNLGYTPGKLAKQVKSLSEDAKISVRNIRHDALEDVKKAELPEDEEKGLEKNIQDLVNDYNKKIESKLKEKEEELMTV